MNERNERIVDISAASVFKVVLVLALVWLLYFFRDLVLVLITSVIIASAVEPAVRWFARFHIPRIPAVLSVYIAIIVAFSGIFYLFVPQLAGEVSNLASTIPQYVEKISINAPETSTGDFVEGISESFSIERALDALRSAVAGFSGNALSAITSVFGGIVSFLLIILFSFYFAVQERGIENFLRIITPVKHEDYVVDLWKRSQAKIGKWMQGQLLLGVIIGILVYLGLTVLGIKYALTLALLAAVAELIPLFGPIIAAIPAVALGFLDSPSLGFMVVGLYIIIQQFENHLIYPLVVRKVVGVPPLLVILSLLIGGKLAGFLGILISVPVVAAILEFTDDIQKEKRRALEKERRSS